jgi:hypothetical protein
MRVEMNTLVVESNLIIMSMAANADPSMLAFTASADRD